MIPESVHTKQILKYGKIFPLFQIFNIMPCGCLAQRVCSITGSWTVRYPFTLESSFWKSQAKSLLLTLVHISSCHLLIPFAIQPQTCLLHLLPHFFYLFHSLLRILIDVLFFTLPLAEIANHIYANHILKLNGCCLAFMLNDFFLSQQWCSGKNTETWFHSWLC